MLDNRCGHGRLCMSEVALIAHEVSLFIGTFTTLLAIINPFEVLPVFLKLLDGPGRPDAPPRRATGLLLRPAADASSS